MVSRQYKEFLNIKWPDYYDDDWDIFQENVRKFHRSVDYLIPETIFSRIIVSDVSIEVTNPEKTKSNDALLYIHGGGFIMGCPEGSRDIVSFICDKISLKGYSPDYRLAPQHPFPSALDDCYTAYLYILEKHKTNNVFVMGDSAGANLALALVQKLIDESRQLPSKVVVLSPPTDFTKSNTFENCELDHITGNLDVNQIIEWYAPGQDLKNPLLSPIYSELNKFPPTYISVGTDEVLFQESMHLYYKMKKAAVGISLEVGTGLCHCYPAYLRYFPEAVEACEKIIKFLMEEQE